MPDDDLVDVGLGELLGLDLVLLGGAQEVVEEGDVELQHLDELDDAAVGDVELAVEVEGPGVGVAAVLGDLPVVDVAGELGGVLVLLVLGLEGADAHPVLLAEDEAVHPDVLDEPSEVTALLGHELLEDEAAGGAQLVALGNLEVAAVLDVGEDPRAPLTGDEVERLLVHGALHALLVERAVGALLLDVPAEGVGRALGRLAVLLHALLEEAGDGALARAHRSVEEDDALLGAVQLRGGLEDVHQLHQRDVEAEDRVAAAEALVAEEVVADELLLVVDVLRLPVAEDHVVDPLEGGAGHPRVLANQIQVVLEAPLPVQLRVLLAVLELRDALDPRALRNSRHVSSLSSGAPRRAGAHKPHTGAGWDRASVSGAEGAGGSRRRAWRLAGSTPSRATGTRGGDFLTPRSLCVPLERFQCPPGPC